MDYRLFQIVYKGQPKIVIKTPLDGSWDEIQEMIDDGRIDVADLFPNADAESLDRCGIIEAEVNHGPQLFCMRDTDGQLKLVSGESRIWGDGGRRFMEVELPLFYWKQGEDMDSYLKDASDVDEALQLYANDMRRAMETLGRIRKVLRGHDVEISAAGYSIWIDGPANVIGILLSEDLACIPKFSDDDS